MFLLKWSIVDIPSFTALPFGKERSELFFYQTIPSLDASSWVRYDTSHRKGGDGMGLISP